MEAFVCKIIADNIITDVKIHRPSRVINFKAHKANIETLEQVMHKAYSLIFTFARIYIFNRSIYNIYKNIILLCVILIILVGIKCAKSHRYVK